MSLIVMIVSQEVGCDYTLVPAESQVGRVVCGWTPELYYRCCTRCRVVLLLLG